MLDARDTGRGIGPGNIHIEFRLRALKWKLCMHVVMVNLIPGTGSATGAASFGAGNFANL